MLCKGKAVFNAVFIGLGKEPKKNVYRFHPLSNLAFPRYSSQLGH
jgi:hypothetical protein